VSVKISDSLGSPPGKTDYPATQTTRATHRADAWPCPPAADSEESGLNTLLLLNLRLGAILLLHVATGTRTITLVQVLMLMEALLLLRLRASPLALTHASALALALTLTHASTHACTFTLGHAGTFALSLALSLALTHATIFALTLAHAATLAHATAFALTLAHAAALTHAATAVATALLCQRGPAAQRCNQYRNHQHALGHHLPLPWLRTNEKFINLFSICISDYVHVSRWARKVTKCNRHRQTSMCRGNNGCQIRDNRFARQPQFGF
jgi:hypothetical protein